MKRRAAAVLLLIVVALVILATVRASEDERGGYHLQGPGFELIYLPDWEAPAAWLYVGAHLVGHWQRVPPEQPAAPDRTPTATPATPRPPRRVMELWEA